MIHFFIGTKAQFIKMAPIMVEMRARGIPFRYIDSGQHAALTRDLRRVFGLDEPDASLHHSARDIVKISKAVSWYLRNLWFSYTRPGWLRQEVFPGGGVCLIHGDTLSTDLGMRMARRAGLKIAHVEAGLRSFKIWDPFPEELIRIHCMRHSDLLFTPSDQAYENLSKMGVRGRIVRIDGNTVADSIRMVANAERRTGLPETPYALATCHRLETLTSKERLTRVVELFNRTSKQMRLVFVMHGPTRKALERYDLIDKLSDDIHTLGMLDYGQFLDLMMGANLVLTDGGSIQEECAYLDKPCLILRRSTERSDGIGKNAVLWGFDETISSRFMKNQKARTVIDFKSLPRPSQQIVDALIELKY